VVSAIGHEPDTPLVDHVADVRCSTPTEAGRRLVPDLAEEVARVGALRDRARRALHGWVDREQRVLAALRARPVLAEPLRSLDRRHEELERLRAGTRAAVERRIDRGETDIAHLRARLTALGPSATLARGYAIVQRVPAGIAPADEAGAVLPILTAVGETSAGERLRIRVGDGAVHAVVAPEEDGTAEKGTPRKKATRKASE
jgi:exodeoxyribonuclease VII large subunit